MKHSPPAAASLERVREVLNAQERCDVELREAVSAARSGGVSLRQIAAATGLSAATVHRLGGGRRR